MPYSYDAVRNPVSTSLLLNYIVISDVPILAKITWTGIPIEVC